MGAIREGGRNRLSTPVDSKNRGANQSRLRYQAGDSTPEQSPATGSIATVIAEKVRHYRQPDRPPHAHHRPLRLAPTCGRSRAHGDGQERLAII